MRLIEFGLLGIWLSEGAAKSPSIPRLRQHETVVRAALRTATPLPLQFGSSFQDEVAAERVLSERSDEFRDKMARVGQRVEMSIQVKRAELDGAPGSLAAAGHGAPASRPPQPTTGRAYLESRREALEREEAARGEAETILDDVEAAFAEMELPAVRVVGGAPGLVGSLAHLVHRQQVRQYREYANSLDSTRPELRFAVTGPWAPYSFV